MRALASFVDRLPGKAMFVRIAAAISAIARDRRGNVMIIMGFAIIPLSFATGMVIDYSRAARLQTKLNAAADAAALSGTTKPMLDKPLLAACNSARRTFRNALEQSAQGLTFTNASDLTISISETYAAAGNVTQTCPTSDATVPLTFTLPITRSVTVTYKGLSGNAFGGILGAPTIEIGGTSTARSAKAAYYQIVFVIDVSNSMGIGGTPADIKKLDEDKTIQCAFACHDPNGTIAASGSDYCDANPLDYFCRSNRNYCPYGNGKCATKNPSRTYSDRRALAKLYGYKLKIDYVNDAVTSFVNALQPKMPIGSTNYAVAIKTFGSGFTTLQATTTSWTTLQTAAGKIDLEIASLSPPGYPNQGWTYTSTGLQSTRSSLTNVGDGSSPTARATYVIFLSDGVEDVFDQSNALGQFNRLTTYGYAQQCQAMKDAGMTVFSVETAYPNVPHDDQYNVLVGNLPSRNGGKQIADVMRDCASSPNRYFMATDGPAIQSAVDNVFKMIDAETTRLSQ